MAFTPAQVIAEVRPIINDAGGVRWPDAELLRLTYSAYLEIFAAQPEAFARDVGMLCAQGPFQTLDGTFPLGTKLLDIIANCDANTLPLPGNVERTTRTDLDRQIPNWATATASNTTRYWAHDERDPLRFVVYPPRVNASPTEFLLVRVAQAPSLPTNTSSPAECGDEWQPAVRDYLCGMAMLKDDTFATTPMAGQYLARFDRAIGIAEGSTESTMRRRDRQEA
ncbi:MAG: Burkholderia virus Bcepil02 [Pseudomonadota bacterium]|jgi:hypothetical protein